MAFKKPTINKTSNSITKLRVYLRAVRKWGKTTLFRDVIECLYNGDASKGLLVGVGYEHGYDMLDNLNATHVGDWKELVELKNWLIKTKGVEHNIEIVAFDVVDELMPMAEKEVCKQSEIKTKKKCETVNSAFGGYGKGQDRTKELVKSFFSDLRNAGFGTWAIAHTKDKTIKEKGMTEDEGYMKLTSNLSNSYESVFGDIFDCVLTGVVDKDVKDGRIVSSVRKLVFRDDGYVEAGCRFTPNAVPEYIVCPDDSKEMAKLVVETLKEGMRKSQSNPVSKKEFEKLEAKDNEAFINSKIEEIEEETTAAEVEMEAIDESTTAHSEFDREKALLLIRKNVKKKGVAELGKDLLAKEGAASMGDLSDAALKEIVDFIG